MKKPTKPLPLSPRLKRLAAALPLILLAACAPPGQLNQIVHDPHPVYSDRVLLGKTAPQPPARLSGDAGLPPACHDTRGPHQDLCVECAVDEWRIIRCYRFAAELKPIENCFHGPDITKCLIADPPFALSIAYNSSEERFLRENFLTWQTAVKHIWLEKLDEREGAALQDMLAFLNQISVWLSTGPAETPGSELLLASLSEIASNPQTEIEREKAMLERLQALRLDGRLTLEIVRTEGLAFLKGLAPDPKAMAALESLSIEGLEEN